MEEEVDLGLSLGLRGASESHCNHQPPPPQLRGAPSLVAPPSPSLLLAAHRRAPATGRQWCDLLASSSSDGRRSLPRTTFLMGIDVNRAPATDHLEPDDEEEEDGVSSPNSTVSSAVSGGRAGNNKSRGDGAHHPNGSGGDENELERAVARVTSDEEDGGEGSRNKKLRLSKEQAAVLEESFKEHHTLNPRQKLGLAKQLSLRPRQVEVWFQNRRARTKLKQTEVDCELLRRCCDGLTEENRRLHKEVQELRALKLLSPQHYMHMAPPTTLTICPSCERVAAVSSAPNPASGTGAVSCSPLGPPPAAGGGGHGHLQHRLRPHVLPPRHLHPAPRRPVPSAGLPLPWASAPLRTPAFVNAPPPR